MLNKSSKSPSRYEWDMDLMKNYGKNHRSFPSSPSKNAGNKHSCRLFAGPPSQRRRKRLLRSVPELLWQRHSDWPGWSPLQEPGQNRNPRLQSQRRALPRRGVRPEASKCDHKVQDLDPDHLRKLWLESMMPLRACADDGVQEKQCRVYGVACILWGEAMRRSTPGREIRRWVPIRYVAVRWLDCGWLEAGAWRSRFCIRIWSWERVTPFYLTYIFSIII